MHKTVFILRRSSAPACHHRAKQRPYAPLPEEHRPIAIQEPETLRFTLKLQGNWQKNIEKAAPKWYNRITTKPLHSRGAAISYAKNRREQTTQLPLVIVPQHPRESYTKNNRFRNFF